MTLRPLLAAGAAALLAACASTANVRPAPRVDLGGTCATTVGELPAAPPMLRKKPGAPVKPVQFADVAHCLDEAGSRRPVALYAVGDVQRPLQVSVRLFGGGGGTLAARVVLLDARFRQVRTLGFGQFSRRAMDYTATAFVNTGDVDVRYVLVEPDPAYQGKVATYTTGQTIVAPIVTTVFIANYVDGIETHQDVPLTDAGGLAVLVDPVLTETVGN